MLFDTYLGRTEAKKPSLNTAIILIAVLISAFCFFAWAYSGGWLVFLFSIPYLLICVAHVWIQGEASRWLLPRVKYLLLASNVFLFAAFMLQWDQGDGSFGWLTYRAFFGQGPGYEDSAAPNWWPQNMALNVILFIPELATLVALYRIARRKTDEL